VGKSERHAPVDSDLNLLLRVEAEMADSIARARREAGALLTAGKARAEEAELRAQADLETEVSALRAAVERQRDGRIEQVLLDARRRVTSLEGVAEPEITEAATWMLARLLEPVPPPGRSTG